MNKFFKLLIVFLCSFICLQCNEKNIDNLLVQVKTDKNQIRPDQDAINAVSPILLDLRETFNSQLKSKKDVHGIITLELKVSSDGKIIKSEITKNSLNNSAINKVLINFIPKIKFNKILVNSKNSIFVIHFEFGRI